MNVTLIYLNDLIFFKFSSFKLEIRLIERRRVEHFRFDVLLFYTDTVFIVVQCN